MQWEEYKSAFVADGYQRHILVQGITLWHWQRYYRFLRKTEARLEFHLDGQPIALPECLGLEMFSPDHTSVLCIGMAGIDFHCSLFGTDALRIDFNPADIDNPAKARLVFRIMTTLGRRLRKEVILYHEQGETLFRYRWGEDGVRYLVKADTLLG